MKNDQGFTPTVKMGGTTLPLNVAKIMSASSIANGQSCLRYKGTRYQVPVGKILRIWVCRMQVQNMGLGTHYGWIGYADDTAFNNSVDFEFGDASSSFGTVGFNREDFDCYIEIPSGKFPYLKSNGGSGLGQYAQFLCEEV